MSNTIFKFLLAIAILLIVHIVYSALFNISYTFICINDLHFMFINNASIVVFIVAFYATYIRIYG